MNLIKLCISIFGTLISFIPESAIILPSTSDITFSSQESYGPFTQDSEDQLLTFSYTVGRSYKLNSFREIIDVYKDDVSPLNLSYSYMSDSHQIVSSFSPKFSFTFKPSISFGIRGISNIVIKIENVSKNKIVKEKTITLVKQNPYLITTSDIGKKVNLYNQLITLSDDIERSGESFDLVNVPTSFSSGTYHTLDLKELGIAYNFTTKPVYYDAFLLFKDPYNIFPRLRRYDPETKYVTLEMIFEDGLINWKPKNLFVNPNTLEICETQIYDFIPTNTFFFPLGTFGIFEVMNFTLLVNDLGLSKSKIKMDVEFYPTNTLIGDCSNSEFCIVGGVDND